MAYKLNVTEHADKLLDNFVYHLIYRLKNKQAAKHLLDCIDVIYDRLEVDPHQFAECRDVYLAKKGYREAVVPQMNYIIIFDVRDDVDMNWNFNEGISRWFHLSELNSLEMPFTSKHVIEHYLKIGCNNSNLYGGIADGKK